MKLVLNELSTRSFCINASVFYGSILRLTLLLILINDLPNAIISQLGMYAGPISINSCLKIKSEQFIQFKLAAALKILIYFLLFTGTRNGLLFLMSRL